MTFMIASDVLGDIPKHKKTKGPAAYFENRESSRVAALSLSSQVFKVIRVIVDRLKTIMTRVIVDRLKSIVT